MIVHNVYFWLKDEVATDEITGFIEELKGLKSIDGIVDLQVGNPAEISREVVDDSYTVGLMVLFKDMASHDNYQINPTHKKFIENNKAKWNKVQIYDIAGD